MSYSQPAFFARTIHALSAAVEKVSGMRHRAVRDNDGPLDGWVIRVWVGDTAVQPSNAAV